VLGAAVLSFVAPALAASPSLPARFASQIKAIKRDSRAPAILLPRSLPIGLARPHFPLYAEGGPSGAAYDLELGDHAKCGADACFVASFSAQKGGTIYPGFTTVTVRGASQAQYHGLLCGGSCSPPQIEYVVKGVLYIIQANLTVPRSKYESTMVAAAEASINAGPRRA
jgi:hypothetical protein